MSKSGLADSPFFSKNSPSNQVVSPPLKASPPKMKKKAKARKSKLVVQPRHRDTTVSTMQPRHQATKQPSNRDIKTPPIYNGSIELIRKTVKEVGKEAATHRFTIEEKRAIKKIVFDYENNDLLTSENQITRIAINFIVDDYHKNGKNSLLDKVLQALNE